ncbi:hypothetical protein CYLTODRAFT_19629 [Cylindrobasidium torrendii FP15055 ss-10]|uniref:Uncharacterized protein n=1 Tax=Cylindrobasidium torrendii FP15055 ss-10 TaxID=1314674 RepID=A0A0D7BQJ5_9AGAR|nr:hypothetical protein CYLTODRAFT_19629 [Cylindrobasidium torrendii FP15055 ss-10]
MNANDQRTQWPGIHHNFPPQTQHANASLPFALPDTPTSMHQPMQLSQDRVQNSNPDANVQRVPAMAIRNGSDEMLALFQRRLNAALAERDNTISHLKGLSADLERRNYDLSDELTRLKLYLETSQNQFKAALANLRRENAHLSAEVSRLKRVRTQ